MKKYLLFSAIGVFMVSANYAQEMKKQLPAQKFEQKEIKADQHSEKAMQQKQLLAKPEQLGSNSESNKKPESGLVENKQIKQKAHKKVVLKKRS